MWLLWICGWILGRRLIGSVLQVSGVVVASVSAYSIYAPAGGLFFAVGLIVFGLSVEKSGDV